MAASSLSPIGCIRELAAALERGEVPPPGVRARIVAAVRQVEQGNGLTLDQALGLSKQWNGEARCQRDAKIIEARDRFLPELSLRQASRRLVQLAGEIGNGRLRSAGDGLTKLVREAIATGAAFPKSSKQIQNILSSREK